MTPDLRKAATLLRQGRLVAFPTETVYGLGADATNPAAIAAIYTTKGRPSTNPLIIHVADAETAKRFVTHWPNQAQILAAHFWPGPLTLVLPKRLPTQHSALSTHDLTIPDSATANLPSVALRVPNHPLALALLREFAGPLAAPSANRSTRVSPTTAQHVRDEFPTQDSALSTQHSFSEPALILDGGPCTVGIESTVLDLTTDHPRILRPGHITPADLEPLIGPVELATAKPDEPTNSPGQQDTHYAPTTPTFRFETSQRGQIQPHDHGLLLISPIGAFKEYGPTVALPNHPADYAKHLYAQLRRLDAMHLKALFIEMPPDLPEWASIRDRLLRATRPLSTSA